MKLMRLCFKISNFFISLSHPSQEEQSSILLLERQMTVRIWIRYFSPNNCTYVFIDEETVIWKTFQAKMQLLGNSVPRRQDRCG